MKVKSLLLGSAAALALGTSAQAADPIAVALDTCDLLSITGLTISSETNCLKFEGEVDYKWTASTTNVANAPITTTSTLDWHLKATATADSDFGPAMAVIKLADLSLVTVNNLGAVTGTIDGVQIDEAYVGIGDASSTVLYAGKKGTVSKEDDDKTLTAIYTSELQGLKKLGVRTGGHVLQVSSNFGDGVTGALGLENLQTAGAATAVAAVGVKQDWGTAHFSLGYDNLLFSGLNNWAIHTGATINAGDATFLVAYETNQANAWQALLSAKTTVDMFTLAAAADFKPANVWNAVLSAEAKVNDTTTLSGAVKFANANAWGLGLKGAFKVSDTLTATGLVKFDNTNKTSFEGDLDWAPGGDTKVNVGLNADSTGKTTFETKFEKKFQ